MVLAASLVLVALPAEAGYGGPWSGLGTACAAGLGCFDAALLWTGATFELTFSDPGTGLELPAFRVVGRQHFGNVRSADPVHCPGSTQEFSFDDRGYDRETDGDVFELEAPIVFCLNGPLDHAMLGTFEGHFLIWDLAIKHGRAP